MPADRDGLTTTGTVLAMSPADVDVQVAFEPLRWPVNLRSATGSLWALYSGPSHHPISSASSVSPRACPPG